MRNNDLNIYPTHDVIMITLLKSFMYDPSIIILNQVPFYDDNETAKRRYINYALISNSGEPITIAILIKPNKNLDETEKNRFEAAIKTLSRLKWIPVVFTEEDIWFRFSYVKKQLEKIMNSYNKKSSDKKVTQLNSTVKQYRLKILEEANQLPDKKVKFN